MSKNIDKVRIEVNPKITPEQLFSFYERNNCCETGYGIEVAIKVLQYSSLIIGAFEGDELVGMARAMFDGVAPNRSVRIKTPSPVSTLATASCSSCRIFSTGVSGMTSTTAKRGTTPKTCSAACARARPKGECAARTMPIIAGFPVY